MQFTHYSIPFLPRDSGNGTLKIKIGGVATMGGSSLPAQLPFGCDGQVGFTFG
jgi:hypothetical protein